MWDAKALDWIIAKGYIKRERYIMRTAINNSVKVRIPYEIIIDAFRQMKTSERETLLEDLIALTSPKYLERIREARTNYRRGRVKTHNAIFGRTK